MRLIIKGSKHTTIFPNDMGDGNLSSLQGDSFIHESNQDFMLQDIRDPGFLSFLVHRLQMEKVGGACGIVHWKMYLYAYIHSWVDPPSQ